MNHEQIDRLDLIDRYLMGKLPAEVISGFEEHFVDCPQCIARLQTTKNFMQDLRLVATEQASQIEPVPPRSSLRHAVTSLFPKPLAWAAACLLIAAAASAVFLIDYTRRLRDEVNQAQQRYEDERRSAMAADRMHKQAEEQRAEQLRELEAKLDQLEAQRAEMAAEPGRRLPAEGSLPLYPLISVRGSEPGPAESVNEINLPRSAAIFALYISLEGETRYETYRITIFDDQRRAMGQIVKLRPDQQGTLSIWLNTSLFRPGHYRLLLEGYGREGGRSEVGNYPFLIVKNS